MARTLTVTLALSLLLPATLAAADDDAEPVAVATLTPIDVGDDAYADDFEDEELGEDVEFCGAGEESIVDLAYYQLENDPAEARRMLVDALRSGGVEDWQRGQALATLAEAQLSLGEHRRAVINYEKALRVDPDGVTQAARVGLATALYLAGSPARARAEAHDAADAVCGDRWSQVPCYAAQRILALTERGDARVDAEGQAHRLRETHTQYAASFDDVDTRLDSPSRSREGAGGRAAAGRG